MAAQWNVPCKFEEQAVQTDGVDSFSFVNIQNLWYFEN